MILNVCSNFTTLNRLKMACRTLVIFLFILFFVLKFLFEMCVTSFKLMSPYTTRRTLTLFVVLSGLIQWLLSGEDSKC